MDVTNQGSWNSKDYTEPKPFAPVTTNLHDNRHTQPYLSSSIIIEFRS